MSVALRLAVLLALRAEPGLDAQLLDARYYLEVGGAIARGEGFGPKPFFMNPGYVLAVAAADRLFAEPELPLALLQIGLDAATCVLAAILASRLAGAGAGLVAGALLALNGAGMLAATRVLPETAAAFGTAALGLLLTRERADAPRNLLGAGALLGAVALLRSNALLVFPFVCLALRAGARTWLRRCALLLAGGAAVVAPVTLRNWWVGHDAVLISSSGGINFYLGNSTESDGRFLSLRDLALAPGRLSDDPSAGRLEQTIRDYAEAQSGRELAPSEVSRFWAGLARAEIAEKPGRWLVLLLRKLFLYANAFEIPQIENLHFLAQRVAVLAPAAWTARLLWPLGLFGVFASLTLPPGPRRDRARMLLAILAGYSLSVLLFFVTARHRLPAAPLVACFAGFGAAHLAGRFRSRDPRRFAFAGGLAVCLLVSNLNPALGQRFVGRPAAQAWLAVDRDYLDLPMQHNNLAGVLLERGDWARAEAELRQGLAANPRQPLLLYNLGRALEQKRDLAGAREALERAVALPQAPASAWTRLAPLRLQAGDMEGALAAFREAERRAPDSVAPAYNRGILLMRLRRFDAAIELFTGLREREPEDRRVALGLTEALLGARRFDEAAALLDGALEQSPDDADALLLRAELHRARGDSEAARAALERALEAKPGDPRARRALERLEARTAP